MDHTLFYELTGILLLAGLVAIIISLLKQPSVIAFIITGLIIGPLGYYQLHSNSLNAMADVGITLLLFMVGLELDMGRLRQLGKVALYTGVGQIVFTFTAGFAIVKVLGFTAIESIYMAVALTFSSTIIVVKLLGEKKDLQSLYARIVVGFLVIQDFAALLILLFLGSTSQNNILSGLPIWQVILVTLIKALLIFLVLLWLSKKVFPHLLRYLGKSDELLLSFSLAWALGLAAFMSLPFVGFSLEIGGFLAGLALANTEMHYEISAKIKSIRDFFIILFFIVFGAQLAFGGNTGSLLAPAVVLVLFVLIVEPVILMIIMGLMGYKPRTSFFASVTVAQVSEFSFILMALGYRLGHVSSRAVGLITLVGITTIALSSYMILYTRVLYERFKNLFVIFNFRKGSAEKGLENTMLKQHVVLVGADRLGSHLIETVQKLRYPLVIVDFNPEIVQSYENCGIMAICGDVTDSYIQDQVNIENARLIISTIPDFDDNLVLLESVKLRTEKKRTKPKMIFAAQSEAEARHLYEKEIDYALTPHFISGMHLARILEDDAKLTSLRSLKKDHLKALSRM